MKIDINKVKELSIYHNPEQIAKILNVNVATLRYQLKINNIVCKPGKGFITPEIDLQIKSLASDGKYGSEIAKILGISQQTIARWIRIHKIETISGKRILKLTEAQKLEIYDLAAIGVCGTNIAKILKISKETVFNFCKKAGIELKKGSFRKYSLEDAKVRLNPKMELTGSESKGFYEVRCKIHPSFVKHRPIFSFYQGCPKCINHGNSGPQIEIEEWIKSFDIEINSKYRIQGKKEIDIHIPSKKIGIEYCGLYWHNENSPEPRTRSYHFNKLRIANEQGIRLITIFEDEWINRQDQVKNHLMSVLHKTTKIYARKTTIKSITKDEAYAFYNKYHIQGQSRLTVHAIGLYYENELVGAISLGKHHRDLSQVVLDRMCFKSGVTVVGGASKLFKALCDYAKASVYSKIISWSDNRWSDGNVYKALGFTLEAELPVDYSYTKNRQRFSKQSKQKKHLRAEGAVGETESEMAKSLGYNRIWDCGKKRWAFNL